MVNGDAFSGSAGAPGSGDGVPLWDGNKIAEMIIEAIPT